MAKTLNPSLHKLITLLSDGAFHDGTALGLKLGISRTAVWKMIKKLEAYDVPLQSQKKIGYALREPLSLLDKTKLKRLLPHKAIKLEIFESLPSTNDYLLANKTSQKIQVCLAEQQTKGRGRFHRAWHSPFAQNLYFSVRYAFNTDISELGGVSLVASLAIAHTLNELKILPDTILLKWPNDIIYDHKKLAGNLVEVQAETHDLCQVILGIGINVNMSKAPAQHILQAWTSLRNITGQHFDRTTLAASLLNNLIIYLARFAESGLTTFVSEWQKYDALRDKKITLLVGEQSIKGVGCGINAQGHLLLKRDDTGKIQAFSAGETTIAKN